MRGRGRGAPGSCLSGAGSGLRGVAAGSTRHGTSTEENIMRTKGILFVAGVVCGIAGGSAAADTVNVQFTGIGVGRNAHIEYNGVHEDVFSGSLWHNFT